MKTMKTKWAKAGTMFLAAAAVLSSCSNEEVIPGGETPVGERDAVKTSFSFAIPSPVSRATSDDVQGNNNFLGIESLRLMPFSGLNGDYVGGNSVLAGATQLTGSDITNDEAENFVKTFTDVTIPSGDIAFLFYGKAKHDAAYKGVLEMTPDAYLFDACRHSVYFEEYYRRYLYRWFLFYRSRFDRGVENECYGCISYLCR